MLRKALKRKFWLDIVHVAAGMVSCILTVKYVVVGVVSTVLFIVYQLDEGWHIRDESWRDILEYSVGYYLAGLMALILNT